MIPLTPKLEQKIKESGIPIVEITLQDLQQAVPLNEEETKTLSL